ncbi:MAG TPA: futalosine hydrolase [Thermodesulfovibrionales bacterium]|nr:futalosine hydrolase [Thermodesulfovibrionales bacterium]
MIALISSVPEEGKLFADQLRKKSVIGGKAVFRGRFCDRDVVYVVSGMGKVNAAHAATLLCEHYSPDMIILFGVGGAYPSTDLRVGDIAVAEKEIYGDEGVLAKDGFHGTDFIGIPLLKEGKKKYYNEFPLDKRLVSKTMKLITHHSTLDIALKAGTFVTVSACTGTRKRAVELRERFNALCENMEGAAVAHVCAVYGIPMVEIRGISNIVEDRNRAKWNMPLAAANCQKAVAELLAHLPSPTSPSVA